MSQVIQAGSYLVRSILYRKALKGTLVFSIALIKQVIFHHRYQVGLKEIVNAKFTPSSRSLSSIFMSGM